MTFRDVAKSLFYAAVWTVGICCVCYAMQLSMPSLFEDQVCTTPPCFQIPPKANATVLSVSQAQANGSVNWNTTNVIFKTQCGSEFINMASNVTYNLTPTVLISCSPVTATVLERIQSGHTRFCKGSHQIDPNQPQGSSGMHQEKIMTSTDTSECFWLDVYTIGYMAWFGQQSAPNWQFCMPTVAPLAITRTQGNSTSSMGVPTVIWQTNPYLSFGNGFYQNGTHQVTLTSGTVDYNLGAISFNSSLEAMAMSHWTGVQPEQDPILLAIETTIFSPLLDSCQMVVSVPRNSTWTELNSWCQSATVTNYSGMITFSATDATQCNIIVGNPKAGNWSVTVGQGLSYRSTIATMWTCSCSGQCGGLVLNDLYKCDPTFNPDSTPTLSLDNYTASSSAGSQGSARKKTGRAFTAMYITLFVILGLLIIVAIAFAINYCRVKYGGNANDSASDDASDPGSERPFGAEGSQMTETAPKPRRLTKKARKAIPSQTVVTPKD